MHDSQQIWLITFHELQQKKLLSLDARFHTLNASDSISAVTPFQTPPGKLTALPRPSSCIWGREGRKRGGRKGIEMDRKERAGGNKREERRKGGRDAGRGKGSVFVQ